MSELSSDHLDDFTLLRYVAGDLSETERRSAARHLAACDACTGVEREIVQLDRELRALAREGGEELRVPTSGVRMRRGDPFRVRPEILEPRRRRGSARLVAERAVAASERGRPLSDQLLAAAREGRVREALAVLSLEEPAHRYGLLYALQSAGARIAESPLGFLRFAEEALDLLRRGVFAPEAEREAETMVPRLVIRGQSHALAGQACIWTRESERARVHLELAYRSFARGGDEINLAAVEAIEAQRRAFLGKGEEALLLARRSAETFESYGLADLTAKVRAVEGNALFALGELTGAAAIFREILPVLERHELWNVYVPVLNNLGATLHRAGHFEEARREYARALRRLSRERDRSCLAYIRHGLADLLFSGRRYREAAISLARAAALYRECGLTASALTASLYEVESWARDRSLTRARHRLDLFFIEVGRHGALDPSVIAEISSALSGDHPDLEAVGRLRLRTSGLILERLRQEAS